MLIDLILAGAFIIIITWLICTVSDGAFSESMLIGIILLLIAAMKVDTIRIVNTSPIISIIISAFMLSVAAIFVSLVIRKANF